MTDFVSIDDMIDARQQAQPGFKKAIGARSYHGGIPGDVDYWDFPTYASIKPLERLADKDDMAYRFDYIAPPEGEPLSKDPAEMKGQLAQAAYFNTKTLGDGLDEMDDHYKEENASMMRRPSAEENQVGARRGPAIGTAMDIKGDLRYGALGNDHPEARLKLAEDDNRRRAMAKTKELATEANLADGEDYGSREMDPDDEMDFEDEDEDDDLPTLKEVGPVPDIGQTPLGPQKKRSSKGPKKKRIPPSEMDKKKMADRATKFNDRHLFKSDEEGKKETLSEADITEDEVDKGGQPVTRFEGAPVIADYVAADAAVGEMDGNEDLPNYVLFDKDIYDDTYKQAISDPKIALEAYRNKQAALEADAENDEFRQEDRLPDNFTSHRFPEHKENLPGAARPDVDALIAARQAERE